MCKNEIVGDLVKVIPRWLFCIVAFFVGVVMFPLILIGEVAKFFREEK